jgi:bifunctional non-homologous end joining protein LigD
VITTPRRTGTPPFTHLERVLWPADVDHPGYTKADLLRYLAAVAPYALPHLRGRPLVLTRYPQGIDGPRFYQKNLPASAPGWLRRFPRTAASGRVIYYLVPEGADDLLWLGQQAAIEFHPWLSRTDHPDSPDRAVIDLDPMPPIGFAEARDVARVVADVLTWAGIRFWVKTSGASGLHFFIPLRPGRPWTEITESVRAVGAVVARRWPERVTLERSVRRRGARVYFDYLQNAPGKTLCAPYSPRPLPGAPVSMPIRWSELDRADPAMWTLATAPPRLAQLGDAWAGLESAPGQDLDPLRRLCEAALR